MSSRQTRPHQPQHQSHRESNHGAPRESSPGSPSNSPADPHSPLPVSADLLQTFDDYGKAADQHPDAMGCAMAKLNVEQMKNLALLEQLKSKFLAQPNLDLRDLQEVLPILDRVHMASKLIKGFALVEYEARKLQMTESDPLRRMRFNAKPDDWVLPVRAGGLGEADQNLDQTAPIVPLETSVPPTDAGVASPETLQLPVASEDLRI